METLNHLQTPDFTTRPYDILTKIIIRSALEVHRTLGPGLLESVYETCLCFELLQEGLKLERQKPLPVIYKAVSLDCGYRLDLVVDEKVIVEIKSVSDISSVHEAQLLSYLKLSNYRVGLLINFNVQMLKHGIKRFIK